jgi:hypothetical protein
MKNDPNCKEESKASEGGEIRSTDVTIVTFFDALVKP